MVKINNKFIFLVSVCVYKLDSDWSKSVEKIYNWINWNNQIGASWLLMHLLKGTYDVDFFF